MRYIKKIIAVAFAFILVVMVTQTPVTRAQTNADLQAQIQALLSALAQLQAQIQARLNGGGEVGGVFNYMQDLTIGSTGGDVITLQSFLYGRGFLTVQPTGYFGPLTQQALASFQASVGISPAVGYFGPITRSYLNSLAQPSPSMSPSMSPSASPSMSPTPSVSASASPSPQFSLMPTPSFSPLPSASADPTAGSTIRSFTVEARANTFSPNEIRVNSGDTAQINLVGIEGNHTFNIDAFNVHSPVLVPFGQQTIQFVAGAKGTYQFYSSVNNDRSAGMTGTFIVQ